MADGGLRDNENWKMEPAILASVDDILKWGQVEQGTGQGGCVGNLQGEKCVSAVVVAVVMISVTS